MDKERIGDFEIFTHPSSNHKQNFILVAEKNISLMCGHKALESLDFFSFIRLVYASKSR